MKKIFLISLFSIIINIAYSQEQDARSYIEYLQQASIAKEAGAYDKALRELYSAAELNPKRMPAYFEIGKIFYEKELYENAIESFNKALKIKKLDYNTLYYKALSLSLLGKTEESFKVFSIIEENFKTTNDFLYEYAWVCLKSYRLNKAEELAIKLYNSEANFFSTFLLGNVYSLLDRYEKSNIFYLQALAFAEKSKNSNFISSTYYNLAYLEKESSNIEKAEEYAKKSIEILPRFTSFLLLGDLALNKNQLTEAHNYYNKAYNKSPNPLTQQKIAEILLLQGKLEEAEFLIQHIFDAFNQEKISLYTINVGNDSFLAQLNLLNRDLQIAKNNRQIITSRGKLLVRARLFFQKKIKIKYLDNIYKKYIIKDSLKKVRHSENSQGFLTLAIANKNYKKTANKYLEKASQTTDDKKIERRIEIARLHINKKNIELAQTILENQQEISAKERNRIMLEILGKCGEFDRKIFSLAIQHSPAIYANNFKRIKVFAQEEEKEELKNIFSQGIFKFTNEQESWAKLKIVDNSEKRKQIILLDHSNNIIFAYNTESYQITKKNISTIYNDFVSELFGLPR
ncbi:MAG: tetratricopeptide repeat protein [Spirochaetales bacterium]|nr:tetratricopeptide repeat protein [Spirochaetales bacterium]